MDKQLVLYPDRCVGCRNCTMLCSMRHFGRYDPSLSAVTVFRFVDENVNVPVMCLQCDDPKCVKACPTQALTRTASGLVELNRNRCIGCKFCVQACPTGMAIHAPAYDTVLKCDLCGGDTLCATWCPTKAIVYTSVPAGSERRMAAADGLRTTVLDEKGSRRVDGHDNTLA